MKTVAYSLTAAKALAKLPAPVRDQIKAKLARYAATGAGATKALVGRPGVRIRAGNYRAVFVETDTVLEVIAVGHRRDVYD